MIKLAYRPVSLLVSIFGGMLAGMIFKQIWKLAAREEDAPKATDGECSWEADSHYPGGAQSAGRPVWLENSTDHRHQL